MHHGRGRGSSLGAATGSVGSIGADGTDSSCVPWPGEEGLARCRAEELWSPLVREEGNEEMDFSPGGGGVYL